MDVITLSSGEEDNTSPDKAHPSDVKVKTEICNHNEIKVPDVTENSTKKLFQKFLESCKSILKKEDASIFINKIQKIHDNAAAIYTSSVEFRLLIKRKLKDVQKDPQNVYIHMKEVADELKLRKIKKAVVVQSQNGDCVSNGHSSSGAGTSAIDNKSLTEQESRHVRKLTKVMRLLNNKIQILETKEVDFDEESDSAYMKLQRYRDRFCKVRDKLGQYLPEVKLRKQRVTFPVDTHPELFRRLENFVNKKNQFPDYHDILKTVIECKISTVTEENQRIARHAFEVVGNELQKKRQYEDWASMSSFLRNEHDPALDNPELEEKLKLNQKEAKTNITSIINKFAECEAESKLEPKEVGDEEAEQSAGEGSGQEEEDEIKNVEDDVDEDDNPDEDTGMPNSPNSIASVPEDEHGENDDDDDILVEENNPCSLSDACTTSPYVDQRFLQPVSPPMWEEYYPPLHSQEDNDYEPVDKTGSASDGNLLKKRCLSLDGGNSYSPKKIRTENSSASLCSGSDKMVEEDIEAPPTILLD